MLAARPAAVVDIALARDDDLAVAADHAARDGAHALPVAGAAHRPGRLAVAADRALSARAAVPNPRISCINSRTCLSVVACVITKAKSPLLFTIKEPSPSVKPTNQVKKLSEGNFLLGRCVLYFSKKAEKSKLELSEIELDKYLLTNDGPKVGK